MNDNKQLMFSLVTGEIYTIEPDELKNMDKYQIPLIKRPSRCKTCYDRFYVGFNTTLKVYSLCARCVTRCVDFTKLPSQEFNIETIKNA